MTSTTNSTTTLRFPPRPSQLLQSSVSHSKSTDSSSPTQSLINDLFYTLKYYPTAHHFYEQVSASCTEPLFRLYYILDTSEDSSLLREKALLGYKYCVMSQMVPQVTGRKQMRQCMTNEMASKQNIVAQHKCKPLIEAMERKYHLIVAQGLMDEDTTQKLASMHADERMRQDLAFFVRCKGLERQLATKDTSNMIDMQYSDAPISTTNPFGMEQEFTAMEWHWHVEDRCEKIEKRIRRNIERHVYGDDKEQIQGNAGSVVDASSGDDKDSTIQKWHNTLQHTFAMQQHRESL
mmetsp:Transcript_3552/g.13599  ORF Transcript_3552/g.13599 Transcript_3552/m.13599 type:complete len:292 (-) Transcript_3552:107-982(-)